MHGKQKKKKQCQQRQAAKTSNNILCRINSKGQSLHSNFSKENEEADNYKQILNLLGVGKAVNNKSLEDDKNAGDVPSLPEEEVGSLEDNLAS